MRLKVDGRLPSEAEIKEAARAAMPIVLLDVPEKVESLDFLGEAALASRWFEMRHNSHVKDLSLLERCVNLEVLSLGTPVARVLDLSRLRRLKRFAGDVARVALPRDGDLASLKVDVGSIENLHISMPRLEFAELIGRRSAILDIPGAELWPNLQTLTVYRAKAVRFRGPLPTLKVLTFQGVRSIENLDEAITGVPVERILFERVVEIDDASHLRDTSAQVHVVDSTAFDPDFLADRVDDGWAVHPARLARRSLPGSPKAQGRHPYFAHVGIDGLTAEDALEEADKVDASIVWEIGTREADRPAQLTAFWDHLLRWVAQQAGEPVVRYWGRSAGDDAVEGMGIIEEIGVRQFRPNMEVWADSTLLLRAGEELEEGVTLFAVSLHDFPRSR